MIIFAAGLPACSHNNTSEVQEQTPDLQQQVDDIKQRTDIYNRQQQADDLLYQRDIDNLRQQFDNSGKNINARIAQGKNDNHSDNKVAAPKKQADEAKKIAPQNPVKESLEVPDTNQFVNILLLDEYGRVPECFKGVRVSDITQTSDGKHTHFTFDGGLVDWNQKVLFSHQYTKNDPPITGAIVWTSEAGEAGKVINIPPYNVYQSLDSRDGTIRYDDLSGHFPAAPKGAGYITAQSILPTQP